MAKVKASYIQKADLRPYCLICYCSTFVSISIGSSPHQWYADKFLIESLKDEPWEPSKINDDVILVQNIPVIKVPPIYQPAWVHDYMFPHSSRLENIGAITHAEMAPDSSTLTLHLESGKTITFGSKHSHIDSGDEFDHYFDKAILEATVQNYFTNTPYGSPYQCLTLKGRTWSKVWERRLLPGHYDFRRTPVAS